LTKKCRKFKSEHFLPPRKKLTDTKVSTGFISHIGAVAENLLFWLDYFLSGCSEKSFSACRKKVFLSERVEPATFGTNDSAKTGASDHDCGVIEQKLWF
jgi:hypothetical protein